MVILTPSVSGLSKIRGHRFFFGLFNFLWPLDYLADRFPRLLRPLPPWQFLLEDLDSISFLVYLFTGPLC